MTTSTASWNVSTDNIGVTGYEVSLKGTVVGTVSGTTFNLTGLSALTAYAVKVRAKDAAGNYSAYTADATFTTPDTEAPTIPTNLTVSSITMTTATASWNASTDNIGVTGYEVYLDGALVATVNGTTYNFTGLNAFTNYTVKVKAKDGAGNSSAFTADETFTTLDTQAPTIPTNLAISSITATSATASWSASTDNAGVTGYEVYLDGTLVTTVNATTYNFTGLNATTNYTVKVRALDGAGNQSGFTADETFTTLANSISYCAASGNYQNYEFIDLVKLGSLNNVSGQEANGYGDYTNMNTNLYKGSSSTMQLSAGFTYGSYSEKWRVWIDLNQNGTFENNERMVQTSTNNAAIKTVNFTIPASAMTGATRMRVIMKYGSYPQSCGTFTWGEVEDYTVTILEDTQAPTIPANLVVSNISFDQADLSWDASTDNSGVVSYEIYDHNHNLLGTTNNTNYTLTGLSAVTNYQVYVIAKDLSGNNSLASTLESFTTLSIPYCDSKGNYQNYEYIDFVGIKSISNATSSDNGYGDFTSQIAQVTNGETVTLTLSAGFAYSNYSERWRVWIDYNQNGTFENNEKVVQGVTYNGNNYSYSFTVPNNALEGNTRMRVVMKYGSYPNPCGNYTWGETEDYTINISKKEGLEGKYAGPGYDLGEELTDSELDINVYPNPAQDLLNIESVNAQSYRIHDLSGRVVKQGAFARKISINDLPNGNYILITSDGRGEQQTRFVKM
jgi:chitodextrinase